MGPYTYGAQGNCSPCSPTSDTRDVSFTITLNHHNTILCLLAHILCNFHVMFEWFYSIA